MSHAKPLLPAYTSYTVAAYDGNELVNIGRGPFVYDALRDLFMNSTLTEDEFDDDVGDIRAAILHTGVAQYENLTLKLTGPLEFTLSDYLN